MDKEQLQPNLPEDDSWLDEILGLKETEQEIGPDESAVYSAGLTHPDEVEIERIVRETMEEKWGVEPETSAQKDDNSTMLFRPEEVLTAKEQPEAVLAEPEEEPDQDQPEERKIRPKMKKGYGLLGIPHVLVTFVWLAIILAIGVTLGRFLWICAADVLAFKKTPKEATITVLETDDTAAVAQKLKDAGMVNNAWLFEFFADITGKGERISDGAIVFSDEMVYDYNALIKAMTDDGGIREVVEVAFPEVYNCAQIFELLEEKGVCSVEDLEKYLLDPETTLDNYWFLEDVKRGHKYWVEGYLAPDTYEFYIDDTPERVIAKFLDEFDDRITDQLRDKYLALNERLIKKMQARGYGEGYIAECQLSFHEVIILASIIEKETANVVESYKISSVFFNRLTYPSEFPKLESDATVLYAIDYYNKGELITDYQINESPFNTYTNSGLPPAPITNPGLNSIGAALSPEDTDYYFFILDREAHEHRFSKTHAEHTQLEDELGYND